MYMFGLFAKPKRKRSSSGGGKMLDTVLAIAVLGGVAFVGYYVLKSGKGLDEAAQTGGKFLKDLVDAGNSSGEAVGNISCHIQKLSRPGLQCGSPSDSRRSSSSKDDGEERDIIRKIGGDLPGIGGYFEGYSRETKKYIKDQEGRARTTQKGIADWFMGLGCGTIRKC